MTFINQGDHPALAEARKRLASLQRRSPPGYPLGYRLDHHHYVCSGCGLAEDATQMVTLRRAGGSGLSYSPTHSSETIYDLPIDEAHITVVSPRCAQCVVYLPRVAIPRLPAGNARLKPHYPPPSGQSGTGQVPDDLLEGLDI